MNANKEDLKDSDVQLSVVIPVFNEEKNITLLYEQLGNTLQALNKSYEIIFIDDFSTDNSRDILDQIAEKDKKVKVIFFKRNFGQTSAFMAGIDHALGEIIIGMDSDLQNDPADIPKLIDKLNEGYDVCSGWRKKRQDSFLTRSFPSKLANLLISKISGIHLHDYGCSLKAYKRDIIKKVKLYGEMHRFIPIYASWEGAKVSEIPVSHHKRKFGKSKYGLERTLKVILDLMVVKFLASYAQKPIYVFGGFGLLNFFLSILSFALMLYFKFFGDKSFIQTPLPLLTALFALVGVVSIFIGFIAEILTRTYYESQGKPVYLVSSYKNMEIKNDVRYCRVCGQRLN